MNNEYIPEIEELSLQIFIENNRGAKDRQDVLQGMVFELKDNYFFKPQAFRDFLKTKRFTKASDSEQYKMFEEFKGTTADSYTHLRAHET